MGSFTFADVTQAIVPVFGTMTTLFFVSLAGYAAVRRAVVDDAGVTAMTRLLVDLIVPAALATDMMAGLNRDTLSQCGTIILIMSIWTLWTMGTGVVFTRIWKGSDIRRDHAIWALCGLHNGIYMPLPMVLALVKPAEQTTAAVLVGSAVLQMVLTQWSLGVALLRGRSEGETPRAALEALKGTLNPPMVAILVGAALSFVPPVAAAAKGEAAPAILVLPIKAAKLVGSTVSPIAMLVLGMLIGQCRMRSTLTFRTLGIPIVVRLILSPLVMLLALTIGPLAWVPALVGLVLIVESASPPATNLSLMARRFGGDWELIVSSLLVTYLTALVTMPLFTALYMAHGR